MAVAGYKDVVLASSPVGYWRLGDGGAVAADSSGNGHDGAASGGVTPGVAGALAGDPNTAMSFDGVTGLITVPFSAALNPVAVGIGVWFLAPSNPGSTTIFLDSFGANLGYRLQFLASGKVQFSIGTGSAVVTIVATNALSLGVYHHVTAANDGALSYLFIDGAQAATPVAAAMSPTLSQALSFGARVNSSAFTACTLDEIGIYNTAPTLAQVQNRYNAGRMPMLAATPVGLKTRDGQITVRGR